MGLSDFVIFFESLRWNLFKKGEVQVVLSFWRVAHGQRLHSLYNLVPEVTQWTTIDRNSSWNLSQNQGWPACRYECHEWCRRPAWHAADQERAGSTPASGTGSRKQRSRLGMGWGVGVAFEESLGLNVKEIRFYSLRAEACPLEAEDTFCPELQALWMSSC